MLLNRRVCSGLVGVVAGLLTVVPVPAQAAELTEVAGTCDGSSNPTFFPNNHRIAVTSPRTLALYDPHGTGQQLVYRDGSGPWLTRTRGAVSNGRFPDPQRADRPASIALARDAQGVQRGWVATSGDNFDPDYLVSVQLRRLSGLRHADGPLVGRALTVQGAERGNARVVLTWLRRTGDNAYGLTVAWFTNLGVDAPRIHHRTTLFTTTSDSPTPTLLPVPGGMRLVTTEGDGDVRVFEHRAHAPLSRWRVGSATARVSLDARPSAVRLDSGRTLVAVEAASTDDAVEVIRFSSPGGSVATALRLTGYEDPSLTRVGPDTVLVMVRENDGAVVSRHYSPSSGPKAGGTTLGPTPSDRAGLTSTSSSTALSVRPGARMRCSLTSARFSNRLPAVLPAGCRQRSNVRIDPGRHSRQERSPSGPRLLDDGLHELADDLSLDPAHGLALNSAAGCDQSGARAANHLERLQHAGSTSLHRLERGAP